MSDMERFGDAGGQLPEGAALYRDLTLQYRRMGDEILQIVEPTNSAAIERIMDDEVAFELNEDRLDLSTEVVGADAFIPQILARPQGFMALMGDLYHGDDRVLLSRMFDSPGTPSPFGTSLGVVVASVEDRPLSLLLWI